MKKLLLVLVALTAGCTYPAYTVRKPLPTDPPLTKEEIERMSNAGVSESVMVEILDKRGAQALTPDDLVLLKKADVPDPVVQKAISAERKVVEPVVVENYYYYGYPGYYPYYGTSFSYGFAWGYPYYGYGWGYGAPRGYMGVRVYR